MGQGVISRPKCAQLAFTDVVHSPGQCIGVGSSPITLLWTGRLFRATISIVKERAVNRVTPGLTSFGWYFGMLTRKWVIVASVLSLVFCVSGFSAEGGDDLSDEDLAMTSMRHRSSDQALVQALLPASFSPVFSAASSEEVLVVAAVGDLMLGTSWPDERYLPPDGGATLLAEVSPILRRADIAFGNLEGPLIDGGTTSKCARNQANCYAFRMPRSMGRYLKEAGFDVLSLANNHALDFGVEGRESTKRVLDQLGIAHSGEVGDIAYLTVRSKKVAVIAFSCYDTSYNLNDIEGATKIIRELATKADIVIVSFHGGAEGAKYQHVPYGTERYLGENRGNLRKFTHAVIDAGADLVLGHGPHVVRGMEVYRDRLIAYSLGNFTTYGVFNLSGPLGLSLILEVHLWPDGRFMGGRIHAVKQERPGIPRLDPQRTIIPIVRRLSQEDFGERAIQVQDDGTIAPPRTR